MKIIEGIADFKTLRRRLARPMGFVATMGYLHEGHLSLVRRARMENLSLVVSIFINPKQFAPGEDFKQYPRDLKHDLALLKREQVDAVFAPSSKEMYPPGFDTRVEVGRLTRRLEGKGRPKHFRGVTTVVAKLFNIVQPDVAYFGQKDAQQAIVIKKMAADLNMNLKIVILPTVRQPDGLALSSRNSYLGPGERRAATVLYEALTKAEDLWSRGERDAERLRQEMTALIQKEPLAEIDYVSVADAGTLDELATIKSPALVSLAVKIGSTRLIDNVVLK